MQSVFHSCARLDGNCRRRAGVYQCRRHFGRFVKESGNGRIRSELNWPEKAFSTTDFESLPWRQIAHGIAQLISREMFLCRCSDSASLDQTMQYRKIIAERSRIILSLPFGGQKRQNHAHENSWVVSGTQLTLETARPRADRDATERRLRRIGVLLACIAPLSISGAVKNRSAMQLPGYKAVRVVHYGPMNKMIMSVRINGQPANLLVDTGSNQLILDAEQQSHSASDRRS
jgi:hypothetical protein